MNKLKTLLIVTLAIGLVTVFAGATLAADWYVEYNQSGVGKEDTDPAGSLYDVLNHPDFVDGDTIHIDPDGTSYSPDTDNWNGGNYFEIPRKATILADDFDDDEGGNDVILEVDTEDGDTTNTDVTSALSIEADGVVMKSNDESNHLFVVQGADTASTTANYIYYAVGVDTSLLSDGSGGSISSMTLEDFDIAGTGDSTGASTAGDITDAALYVKQVGHQASGITVDNWEVTGFLTDTANTNDVPSYGTAVYLDDNYASPGYDLDVDVKNSTLGTDSSTASNTRGVVFDGTYFSGSVVSSNSVVVENDADGRAVLLGGQSAAVKQNNIIEQGSDNHLSTAIEVTGSSHSVKGNHIQNGDVGILMSSTSSGSNVFQQNYIHVDTGTNNVDITAASLESGNSFSDNNFGTDSTAVAFDNGTTDLTLDTNYWEGVTDTAGAEGEINDETTLTGPNPRFAADVTAAYVDTDSASQDQLSLGGTPPAIYGYNNFAKLDGGTEDAALDVITSGTSDSQNTVTVKDGTYNGDSSGTATTPEFEVTQDYLTIQSANGKGSTDLEVDDNSDQGLQIKGLGVKVDGFTITDTAGNDVNNNFVYVYDDDSTGASLTLVDSEVDGSNNTSGAIGLYFTSDTDSGTASVELDGTTIKDTPGVGLGAYPSSNVGISVTVKNSSTIDTSADHGLLLDGSAAGTSFDATVSVSDSTIKGMTGTGNGIFVNAGTTGSDQNWDNGTISVDLSNATIDNTAGDGVKFQSGPSFSSMDVTVTASDSTIKGAANGVNVDLDNDESNSNSFSATLTDTEIDNTDTDGVIIDSSDSASTLDATATLSGVTVKNVGTNGIDLAGDSDSDDSTLGVTVEKSSSNWSVVKYSGSTGLVAGANVDKLDVTNTKFIGNGDKGDATTAQSGGAVDVSNAAGPDSEDVKIMQSHFIENAEGLGGDPGQVTVLNGTSDDTELNARRNYWGDSSGPYNPTTNPDGEGAKVDDNVNFQPYWTKVSGFETIRGLKRPTIRLDESESFSLDLGRQLLYTFIHTPLRPGGGLVD